MYNLTMDKIFNPDNPVMIVLSRLFDLILLNVCFVIACIPGFTAGPAMAALYTVALRMADGEFGDTAKVFFSSFRKNFRDGVILWLILLFSAAFFGTDLYIVYFVLPAEWALLQIPVWIMLFVVASEIIYVFPLLARYEQSIPQLLKNAVLLSLANVPLTVFIAVIAGVMTDIALHNGSYLVLFFSIFLFIGFALLARIFSIFFKKTFERADDKGV